MADVICDSGWWAPGNGEPGEDWEYEHCSLHLVLEDGEDQVDVMQVTPTSERALVSLPVAAIGVLFAQAHAVTRSGGNPCP